MPDVKSLLREFGRVASTQCFPVPDSQAIELSITQESNKYVAPEDGWFVLNANGTNIQTEILCDALETLSTNMGNTWGRCFCPVRKGSEITFNVWGFESGSTACRVRFVPARGFV